MTDKSQILTVKTAGNHEIPRGRETQAGRLREDRNPVHTNYQRFSNH